jgi:4-azaleucine resistance transporter AzlC
MEREAIQAASHPLRSAWAQAFPIVLGYLPIGFAFGILAQKAGISGMNTLAMSLLVYAGSAQLIAVGLFAAAASPFSIVLTTLVVNLRHLLMSAALSPYLGSWKRSLLPIFAYEVTDETFAVHSVRFPQAGAHPNEALLINVIAQASWVAGTWLGIAAGSLIQDVKPFGLDYALPAMFIALLVFQLKDRRTVAVALAGGLLSVILLIAGLSQWNVIVATLIAATLGVMIDSWTKPASS